MRITNFLLALSLLALSASPTSALPQPKYTQEYLDYVRQMLDLIRQADNQLYKYMQMVANGMEHFYVRNGHYPEPGPEQERLLRLLTKQAKGNPYDPKVYDAATTQKIGEIEKIKVLFLVDGLMDREFAKQARTTFPPSWKADPGTIVVISNGSNKFMVWGAGADRQPIKDEATGKMRTIFRDSRDLAVAPKTQL